jgi:hypothetical protein
MLREQGMVYQVIHPPGIPKSDKPLILVLKYQQELRVPEFQSVLHLGLYLVLSTSEGKMLAVLPLRQNPDLFLAWWMTVIKL